MPGNASQAPAPRQRQPYTTIFQQFSADQRRAELAELKKLYEKDRLSIRQIAQRKQASYGFMHARLHEAGANLHTNSTFYRPPAPQDEKASESQPGTTPLKSHNSAGTHG